VVNWGENNQAMLKTEYNREEMKIKLSSFPTRKDFTEKGKSTV
jgi:hypothetical protein